MTQPAALGADQPDRGSHRFTGTSTIGIGQMRRINGVELMEMQTITGSGLTITHWAYMTPYNPNVFTPPSPTQFVTTNITSPEWRWSAGTTWQIRSQTLFGTPGLGTFKITDYSNGYYWGLGAAPLDSTSGNFTVMGSMTPEGNVLFGFLDDGVLTGLAGQIAGEGASGPVNVFGTLAGSGRVGTASVAGGTLAPGGNGIGTLTVQGNLSFAPGSLYAVEVAPHASDRVNVAGIASLKGTVVASFAPVGTYSPRAQSIVSAAGGRVGAFDALVAADLPAGFLATLSYTPTDVLLNLTAGLGGGTPLNANQSAVAAAINNGFNTGNSLPSGLSALFGQTGATLAGSLGALSGEVQTGAQVSAFAFGSQFLDTVLARGGGAGVPSASQYASLTAAEPAPEPRRLRGWLAGFGGYGWLNGQASTGSSAVQTSTQGLAAGGDWTFDEGMVGFAVTGGSANWFLGNGLGTGRGNMFQAGLYGRTMLGPVYLAAAGTWGQFGVSTQRPVPYLADWLTANYTATTWSGRAEIGHRVAFGEHGVTPFVAWQGQLLNTPGFCETSQQGSGTALCFGGGSASSLRSEVGLEGDTELGSVFGARTRLVARLAWAHEYQTTGSASAWFQSLPGSSFVVSGAPLPSDIGIVRVMSNVELNPSWSLRFQADAEFADRYASIGGTVRIAGRF